MTRQELKNYEKELFYDRGCNCAQTVLLAMSKYFGKENESLLKNISSAFGGGLSGIRVSVCGAVSGGIMVVGLMENGDIYGAGQELIEYVNRKRGNINCDGILDIDFNDKEQVAREKAEKKDSICTPLIENVCAWLADRYDNN